jgi:hypothetical protein
MTEQTKQQVIVWTARVAALLYLLALREWCARRSGRGVSGRFRLFWASSWLTLLVHVVCAFHLKHDWSHAAAIEHTARMTENVTGWYWAGGLYINYAFLLLWGAEVLNGPRLGCRWTPLALQLVAAFMWFNATVVFGTVWWLIPLAIWLSVCLFEWQSQSSTSSVADPAEDS